MAFMAMVRARSATWWRQNEGAWRRIAA
jgi:hypothetical protein